MPDSATYVITTTELHYEKELLAHHHGCLACHRRRKFSEEISA